TQLNDYAFIPFPLQLPIFGFGYRNIDINGAYVPGIKNDGNVLFMFARISF
ncbi:MAG: phospholipid:lipid A palmitoyltransferase, partial [Alphaproteobacteria bacterium]|nr:phospholipid:lipid A palmitoyltransferase [Alphaproteobacteria bacterium]